MSGVPDTVRVPATAPDGVSPLRSHRLISRVIVSPRELVDLRELASQRGQVRAVAFTHGHWDHVAGWQTFPGAKVCNPMK
jgi:glyoxylase-like metal-dependent hydrolase (beta-lactamase superfamily II)